MNDGGLVEVPNISDNPETSFRVDPRMTIQYQGDALATWHTHPGGSSNLSVDDYECFMMWPDLLHVIIGEKDLAIYRVEDGELLRD